MDENKIYCFLKRTISSLFFFFIEFICEILLLSSVVVCILFFICLDSLSIKVTLSVIVFSVWYLIAKVMEKIVFQRKKKE